METRKKNIRHLSQADVEEYIEEIGEKKFRAKQIWEWLWLKHAQGFDDMTNLSKELRNTLSEDFSFPALKIDATQYSADGTIKSRFKTFDNHLVEGVLIPTEERKTACVSSQIGCSLSCKFCATGYMEKTRMNRIRSGRCLMHLDHAAVHQAEVAAVERDVQVADRVPEPVEAGVAQPLEETFLPMAANPVDDVIPLLPDADELRDHLGRVLQVAVHQHDGLAARVIDPGRDGGLVAEVPAQVQDDQAIVVARPARRSDRRSRRSCRRRPGRSRTRRPRPPARRSSRRCSSSTVCSSSQSGHDDADQRDRLPSRRDDRAWRQSPGDGRIPDRGRGATARPARAVI